MNEVANNEAVIEATHKWAAMPDCGSLHLNWAHQSAKGDHYLVSAQFVGSRSCMDRWDVSLDSAGFEAKPLLSGERTKEGVPDLIVTPVLEGNLRGVMIPVESPLKGVTILSRENKR